jgi:hypothetical protein
MNNINKQTELDEDLLKKYLGPEKAEMAPEDFTERVMGMIQAETIKLQPDEKPGKKYFVPVLSALITLALIIATYLGPVESNEPLIVQSMKFIENINKQAMQFRIDFPSEINFPGWLIYFFIGILFFALFDKFLHGVFQREK